MKTAERMEFLTVSTETARRVMNVDGKELDIKKGKCASACTMLRTRVVAGLIRLIVGLLCGNMHLRARCTRVVAGISALLSVELVLAWSRIGPFAVARPLYFMVFPVQPAGGDPRPGISQGVMPLYGLATPVTPTEGLK